MKRPQDFSQSENFGIEEVQASSDDEQEQNIDNAGEVERWERLKIERKSYYPRKWRQQIYRN